MDNPMVNYSNIIAETAKNHFNVKDEYKANTVEQNAYICHLERRKFAVGAINITGELNIGMMIRSASLFGAEKFYIFGRKKFDKRSTVGAENYIEIVHYTYDAPIDADEQIANDIKALADEYAILACEQGGFELGQKNGKWAAGVRPLFLFGSESHGIPQKVLDTIPKYNLISIPQVGVLRSFNVSAAMNIVLWDYVKDVYL